jgi:large subunit ribosomal protein L22
MELQIARAERNKIRVSPRKLNLIAQQIRGMNVDKALDVLKFSQKRNAAEVYKALASAVANAENNHGMDIDNLVVHQAVVGQGFAMKRFQARAKGRGVKIKKYFSHLFIEVAEKKA